jgi:CO/xanthine dehydrogenase Mo-binding subunit
MGAVAQGIGFALTEEFIFDDTGRVANAGFMNYKIPSVRDMPEIVPIIVETYEPAGVYGSKAVAEINMNGPLPTIANAIYDAVGIRIQKSPFTPEKVLKALRAKAGKVTK